MAITTDEPATAYTQVLNQAGAWDNYRPADWLDGLTPTTPPTDSDNDGMPDDWETTNGLNPNDGSDHTTVMPSGYTAIEAYINEVADGLVAGS